jgi:hypothetical protein
MNVAQMIIKLVVCQSTLRESQPMMSEEVGKVVTDVFKNRWCEEDHCHCHCLFFKDSCRLS